MYPDMELYFDIGGIPVRLTAPDGSVAVSGNLKKFLVPPQPCNQEVELQFSECFPAPSGVCIYNSPERCVYGDSGVFQSYIGISPDKAHLYLERCGSRTLALARPSAHPYPVEDRTALYAMELEHLAARHRGILLHASFIQVGGEAILFTAPSGTGKSTQAELWRVHRGARILNGDRCLVRVGPDAVEARGVPFSGTSGICELARLPLKAIVCLSQNPENTVKPLKGFQAFRQILSGCSYHTWNRMDVEATTDTVTEILRHIPIFHLACTPDEGAVCTLEQALNDWRPL